MEGGRRQDFEAFLSLLSKLNRFLLKPLNEHELIEKFNQLFDQLDE